MSFIGKLFKKKEKTIKPVLNQEKDEARYEVEKQLVKSDDPKQRIKLAKNPRTHLEVLYYLAEDDDVRVRRAVASNSATPLHVSRVLAEDNDVDVRLSLAERLMAMLPELDDAQHAHLYAFAVQSLGMLALDEVLKVRLSLSSVLKDKLYTPPEVAAQLARDVERRVSEPVLKLCAAIPDKDLVDILMEHPESWVIQAIAERDQLSALVSDAVFEANDVEAGAKLIANETADISLETLEKIIEKARNTPEWHRPLALRKHLPSDMVLEILDFLDVSLQKLVSQRDDFDDETKALVVETVARRMRFLVDDKGRRIDPKKKVQQLYAQNNLNEDHMSDALALRENDFVIDALALKTGLDQTLIRRMIDTHSPKAVTALAWKAGLSMRFALALQQDLAKVAPRELLYPRNGEQFPLSEDDMQWQIEFFTEEQ
jgi:uncharacterized protein (DUF2336 family)